MIGLWTGVADETRHQGFDAVWEDNDRLEDDLTLRTLLVEILSELGAACAAFDNAEDALINMLGLKDECSLIVVDHGVPGSIQGMEFISMAHERWPGLPAILTSGYQLDASHVTPPVI